MQIRIRPPYNPPPRCSGAEEGYPATGIKHHIILTILAAVVAILVLGLSEPALLA